MASARTSLVEQKRIQWAREREEMSRLTGNSNPLKSSNTIRTTIRTYPNGSRTSLTEMNGKPHNYLHQPRYASTISLQSLSSDASNTCNTSFRNGLQNTTSASLINLQDQMEIERMSRRRSPSLPPIVHSRDEHNQYQEQELNESKLGRQSRQQSSQRATRTTKSSRPHKDEPGTEEREGETSGYASDNLDASAIQQQQLIRQQQQQQQQQHQSIVLPCHVNCNNNNNQDPTMSEKTWQNPYYYVDENSLPSSRSRLASLKAGEFNRQRWGSVWGQELSKDPPPPSWLERGLSRLDHSSQVLVINHDSASSPDSSTTGSLNSDTNKTYLRGHNLPVDADQLQERELRRQKALELQEAIKQQLEERERRRKEERERKLRDELDEEERIKRERDIEKQRLEEEQRRQRDKEAAKQKKNKAMQEMLEAAERQAKEDKRIQLQQRRKRDDGVDDVIVGKNQGVTTTLMVDKNVGQNNRRESMDTHNSSNSSSSNNSTDQIQEPSEIVRVPVSQEVAIVLSARIEDPDLLSKSPLKLVNLVVSPSTPRNTTGISRSDLSASVNALLAGSFGTPVVLSTISPRSTGNRLLTPSKYRVTGGRDCGTQTDCEDLTDYNEKLEDGKIKEIKDRKEAINNSRRDVDKSTSTDNEQPINKITLPRSKNQQQQQSRASIESRPRWNANRPGTRYRTQSEKDPHYQRRMRLRRRQVDTSDEGSSDFRRSPSPGRRKYGVTKAKSRNSGRRKLKHDNYDADASMDSLNSLVPLHTDKNGRVNIERPINELLLHGGNGEDNNLWCGDDILSHLNSLRNKKDIELRREKKMANFQLEDLLRDDKKDANLIPDLSKATCNSDEEFRRLMECVPEFKLRPEKVRKEDIKVRDKCFTFKMFTKKKIKSLSKKWNYGDPIPPDMRSLNLQELQQVPIDWRMLTSVRPKLRQDEEMFSRLVEMGKLQLKTRARERRGLGIKTPLRRFKNRAGIIETSVRICGDCGEEWCDGEACGDILYDAFMRVSVTGDGKDGKGKQQQPTADAAAIIAGMDSGAGGKKKVKRKIRKRRRKKKKTSEMKEGTEAIAGPSSIAGPSTSKGIGGGFGGPSGSGAPARVLARKGKTTTTSTTRRESERSEEAKEPEQRKFRRKCSKYPTKNKKGTIASKGK